MFGSGPMELIIILLIVLVLFGAKKLPQIKTLIPHLSNHRRENIFFSKKKPAPGQTRNNDDRAQIF